VSSRVFVCRKVYGSASRRALWRPAPAHARRAQPCAARRSATRQCTCLNCTLEEVVKLDEAHGNW